MNTFVQAMLFQAGYNVALVTVGAILLGIASGSAGTFLFLRKRALVSDAIAHATLAWCWSCFYYNGLARRRWT